MWKKIQKVIKCFKFYETHSAFDFEKFGKNCDPHIAVNMWYLQRESYLHMISFSYCDECTPKLFRKLHEHNLTWFLTANSKYCVCVFGVMDIENRIKSLWFILSTNKGYRVCRKRERGLSPIDGRKMCINYT